MPGRDLGLDVSPGVAAVDVRCLARPGIGTSAVVRAILEELSADGWELCLLSNDAQLALDLERQYPGSEVVCLPKTTWLWWEQVQVPRWLASRHPDIWVAPINYGAPPWRPRQTKCILVVHDLVPLLYPRRYLLSQPSWAAMYLFSVATSLISADLVVAVSDASAAQVRRFSRRSAVVVHPPVPKALAHKPAPPLDEPYVVFNGGFDSRKSVPQLLDAFAEFRESPEGAGTALVIMGDRSHLARPMLAERGLAGACVVTGYVSEDEKWAWLANAIAVAYPSLYEGFGIVVAEAFAAGTPVVCGTGGALRYVGGDAAIFVDPERAQSIAEGLRAACDPAVRRRAIEKGFSQLELLRRRSGGWARLARSLTLKAGAQPR